MSALARPSRRALNDDEGRIAATLDLAAAWIWETDANDCFTFVSDAFAAMTGRAAEAFIGRTRTWWLQEIAAPPTLIAAYEDARKKQAAFRDHVYQFRRSDGAMAAVSVSAAPRFDESGALLGYYGVGVDITETISLRRRMKSAQEALAAANAELAAKIADRTEATRVVEQSNVTLQGIIKESVDALDLGFLIFDEAEQLVYANAAVASLDPAGAHAQEGVAVAGLARAVIADGAVPAAQTDPERWAALFLRRFRKPCAQFGFRLRNGAWIAARSKQLPSGYSALSFTDATDLKAAADRLAAANAQLDDAIQIMDQGLVVYEPDANGEPRLALVNEQAKRLVAAPPGLFKKGRSHREVLRFFSDRGDYDIADAKTRKALTGHAEGAQELRFERETPGGHTVLTRDFRRPDGTVVITLTDVTDAAEERAALRRKTERLGAASALSEHLALHDPLTGLPNRRYLADVLDRAAAQSARRGERCGVLHLDLDGFKRVNDLHGHAAGDQVLREAALAIAGAVRRDDFVARIGGDEFVVVCTAVDDHLSGLAGLAERLISRLSQPFQLDGVEARIGLSIGIAVKSGAFDPADTLRKADAALYRAKAAGRGRFAFFSDLMRRDLARRAATGEAFRSALASGAVETQRRPIVDTASGAVIALQVEPFWRGGMADGVDMNAASLFQLARETGRLQDLDAVTLADASAATVDAPEVVITLSGTAALARENLATLAGMAQARRVAVGLPETALAADADAVTETLTRLRAANALLQIDQFGATHGPIAAAMDATVARLVLPPEPHGLTEQGHADRQRFDALAKATVAAADAGSFDVCAASVDAGPAETLARRLGLHQHLGATA